MVDLKVYKPVSASFAATAAGAGTFPAPVGVGSPVSLTASTVGVLFTVFASSDGTSVLSVVADNTAAPATPVGVVVEGVYVAVLPTYTSGNAAVMHTSINGELLTLERKPGTSAVTSVPAAVVSTSLLAANTNRRGATVFNDSATAGLYLKLGTAASATSFTVLIPPNNYYELPDPAYTGIVHGIWTAAVGDARITELTV